MKVHDYNAYYGLHIIGGTCEECGERYVKRSLYVPLTLTVEHCYHCRGAVPYTRLRWSKYVYWMDTFKAVYVESVVRVPLP